MFRMEHYESVIREVAAIVGDTFTVASLRVLAKRTDMPAEVGTKLKELAGWIERPVPLAFVLSQCVAAVRERAWADGDVARFRAADGSKPLPQDAEAFMRDLWALYKRHGLAISHEDEQGGFLVVDLDFHHAHWMAQAMDRRK